jgi:hypothetical protein
MKKVFFETLKKLQKDNNLLIINKHIGSFKFRLDPLFEKNQTLGKISCFDHKFN